MSDLIRREDAMDAVNDCGICIQKIMDLPSAEPERKTGKWIEYPECLRYEGAYADDQIVCSECHHVFSILDNCTEEFDFCPHCGSYNGGE